MESGIKNSIVELLTTRATTRSFSSKVPTDRILLKCLRKATYAPFSCNLWNVRIVELSEDDKRILSKKAENCPRAFAILQDSNIKHERHSDIQSIGAATMVFMLGCEEVGLSTFWMAGVSGDRLLKRSGLIHDNEKLLSVIGVGYACEPKSKRSRNVQISTLFKTKDDEFYRNQIKKVYCDRNKTFTFTVDEWSSLSSYLKNRKINKIYGNIDRQLKSQLLTSDINGVQLHFFAINRCVKPKKNDLLIITNPFKLRNLIDEVLLAFNIYNFYDGKLYKIGYTGWRNLRIPQLLWSQEIIVEKSIGRYWVLRWT